MLELTNGFETRILRIVMLRVFPHRWRGDVNAAYGEVSVASNANV
jgi:hypothetical protein